MTDPHARSSKLPAAKPLRPIGEMSSLAHNAQLTELALDARMGRPTSIRAIGISTYRETLYRTGRAPDARQRGLRAGGDRAGPTPYRYTRHPATEGPRCLGGCRLAHHATRYAASRFCLCASPTWLSLPPISCPITLRRDGSV